MAQHVRILIAEGAPPPWVSFNMRHTAATTVDISQRSMDIVKMQQAHKEDPEFVRQRRAAIDTLLSGQTSKRQRFSQQDFMRGINITKGLAQVNQKMSIERPNRDAAAASFSSSVSNDLVALAVMKVNKRLPKRAKKQIVDKPTKDKKGRPQSDRKQSSKRKFNDDDDNRPKRAVARKQRGKGCVDDEC